MKQKKDNFNKIEEFKRDKFNQNNNNNNYPFKDSNFNFSDFYEDKENFAFNSNIDFNFNLNSNSHRNKIKIKKKDQEEKEREKKDPFFYNENSICEINPKINFFSNHHFYWCIYYKTNITIKDAKCGCYFRMIKELQKNKSQTDDKINTIKVHKKCEDCRNLFSTDEKKAHYRTKCYNCFNKRKEK